MGNLDVKFTCKVCCLIPNKYGPVMWIKMMNFQGYHLNICLANMPIHKIVTSQLQLIVQSNGIIGAGSDQINYMLYKRKL